MSHCFYLIYHIFKSKAIYQTLCHFIYVPDKSLPGDLVLTQLSACRANYNRMGVRLNHCLDIVGNRKTGSGFHQFCISITE